MPWAERARGLAWNYLLHEYSVSSGPHPLSAVAATGPSQELEEAKKEGTSRMQPWRWYRDGKEEGS